MRESLHRDRHGLTPIESRVTRSKNPSVAGDCRPYGFLRLARFLRGVVTTVAVVGPIEPRFLTALSAFTSLVPRVSSVDYGFFATFFVTGLSVVDLVGAFLVAAVVVVLRFEGFAAPATMP